MEKKDRLKIIAFDFDGGLINYFGYFIDINFIKNFSVN